MFECVILPSFVPWEGYLWPMGAVVWNSCSSWEFPMDHDNPLCIPNIHSVGY